MSNSKDDLQPWQKSSYISFGIIRLHEEISDFVNYVHPTVLEETVRNYVFNRVKTVLVKRWPLIDVHIFGSFATGLYLPTSDIDIVVFGRWDTLPLWDVEQLLLENDISSDIRIIDKASVPIVKFIEKETGYQVDISFNKDNSIRSIPIINEFLAKYPSLRHIYLVLKQFMFQRDLNEVWTGGISSYCLMLLCISFFQNYNKNYIGQINLGCLLMEFFELYGRCFNFFNAAIYVTKKGGYRVKLDPNNCNQKSSIISIEDPVDKDNDVAKSCFGLFNIRHAFTSAYSTLYSRVSPACIIRDSNSSGEISMNESILGSIVSFTSLVIQFREKIQSQFAGFVNNDIGKIRFILPNPVVIEEREETNSVINKGPKRRSKREFEKTTKSFYQKNKQPKKIHKARDWNDLAQWSQENVFKSPILVYDD